MPTGDEPGTLECRIELCVALGQPRLCRIGQVIPLRMALREKAEPFEHRAIAEPLCVVDEHVGIGVLATHVLTETIGNVLYTAAAGRVIEHVDDRSVNIRNQYPTLAAPDSPGAEEVVFLDVFERKDGALARDPLLAH